MASAKNKELLYLRLRVNYNTSYGDNLCVSGGGALGNWKEVHRMNARGNGGEWEITVALPASETELQYKYHVLLKGGSDIWEGGSNRVVNLQEVDNNHFVEVRDSWRPPASAEVTYFDTSLFRDVIFARKNKSKEVTALNKVPVPSETTLIRFTVLCTPVGPNSTVSVAGSAEAMGGWDTTKSIDLSDFAYPLWSVNVLVPNSQLPFTYKYLIKNKETGEAEYEEGVDRIYSEDAMPAPPLSSSPPSNKSLLFNDGEFRLATPYRGAGVAVPVFSLRTKKGLGVGEFLDLKDFVDWSVKTNLNLIQILPINDTTVFKDFRDSYPYSAVSVFALNALYIRIDEVSKDKAILAEVEEKRAKLNSLKQIDFVEVMDTKTRLLQKIFTTVNKTLDSDKDFVEFVAENKIWLAPYALFCVFRDEFGTSEFSQWKERATITPDQITEMSSKTSKLYPQILYSYWVQWHLHKQLSEASSYAKENRVGFKGDLPIGVNRSSVDTWVYPHLFRMNMSTGAPPDAFADDGQNWGFPTYAWDVMAKDNYGWWRARLGQMAKYFTAFRIDHILGFFRIWEIPFHCVTGLLGRFNPALPLAKTELTVQGVWDIDRLCEPYIRWHLIEQIFGDRAHYAQHAFFSQHPELQYVFKPEFNTEKKIRDNLSKEDQWMQPGLFKLLQNVILLKDSSDPSSKFHPRIDMQKTTSFTELDEHTRFILNGLYISYFYERQEDLWRTVGAERLPVIRSCTKMLVCGEDLGMVPKCVPGVLENIGILGLRIQRMPSDSKIEFYTPAEYPYLTVCSTSSHDMSTLRGWWEEDRIRSQRFYTSILGFPGAAPFFCESYVSQSVLNQHLTSPSMWAIFPIQDLMGISQELSTVDPREQKINEPSNPIHYWRYRLHVQTEDLLSKFIHFDDTLKALVSNSGRKIDI